MSVVKRYCKLTYDHITHVYQLATPPAPGEWRPTVVDQLYRCYGTPYAHKVPWITYVGPNGFDDGWWWYCECSAYNGGGTEDDAVRDGTAHGLTCDKGMARYFRGGPHQNGPGFPVGSWSDQSDGSTTDESEAGRP